MLLLLHHAGTLSIKSISHPPPANTGEMIQGMLASSQHTRCTKHGRVSTHDYLPPMAAKKLKAADLIRDPHDNDGDGDDVNKREKSHTTQGLKMQAHVTDRSASTQIVNSTHVDDTSERNGGESSSSSRVKQQKHAEDRRATGNNAANIQGNQPHGGGSGGDSINHETNASRAVPGNKSHEVGDMDKEKDAFKSIMYCSHAHCRKRANFGPRESESESLCTSAIFL
jgi:hypothetical protein